jgi:BirA family biotin operon repressor/biotin-[acetyl-CoA-carboxylase] ligase
VGAAEVPWGAVAADPAVAGALTAATRLRTLHPVGEVGSTQDRARELAVAGAPDGTVVLADVQRRGRGRTGGTWDDDADGGSLAVTVLLDVAATVGTVPLLPLALGVAVVDACRPIGPTHDLRLKWPNDVVVRDAPRAPLRKLAGVLVERERVVTTAGPRDVLLCGIGLNVTLGGPSTADRIDLAALVAAPPDRALLLAGLVTALDGLLPLLAEPERLLDRVRALSDTVGRRVRVLLPGEAPLVGTAVGIDDAGRLVVDTDGRTRAILSGTVRDEED